MPLPQTGFEQRGKTPPWTTFPEEAAYFTDLLAQAPNLTRTQVGVGATGLPMLTYTVGTGPHKIFLVAHQHAPERASREALLIKIREWATTTNPVMLDYLQDVTIIAMPTARPDSQSTRDNANGVNLNRDHLRLTQPETQAIHSVISSHKPGVIVDMHEGRNITADFATSPLLNPNLAPSLMSLSTGLEQAVKTGIEVSGYSWEEYQNWNVRGPEYLVNAVGVHHAVGLLQESRWPQDSDLEMPRRLANHLTALDSIINWHAANLGAVAAARSEAETLAVTQSRVVLNGGTFLSGPILAPPPTAYRVTPQQEAALQHPAAAYGFQFVDGEGGRLLVANGVSSLAAHYAANSLSPQALVDGDPVWEVPPVDDDSEPGWPQYFVGGPAGNRRVVMVRLGTVGGPVTVWP